MSSNTWSDGFFVTYKMVKKWQIYPKPFCCMDTNTLLDDDNYYYEQLIYAQQKSTI